MEGQKRFVVESAGRVWASGVAAATSTSRQAGRANLSRAPDYRTADDRVNVARRIDGAPSTDLGVMELGLVVFGEHWRLPA